MAASLDWVQSEPACCACGEQIEMSRAAYALPRGGGEDVNGPEVSARDEARNLGLSSVVTGLSSVDDGGDRVVTAGGLAQGAAGGVSSARVQELVLAFAGLGALHAQSDRVDVLLGLQHSSVVEGC